MAKYTTVKISIAAVRVNEDITDPTTDLVHDSYRLYFSLPDKDDMLVSVSISDYEFSELSKEFDLSIDTIIED